jgi:hypothetical protein
MSSGKYQRFSPQRGYSATIHESGNVWTCAGMFRRHPLQMMTKGNDDKGMDAGRWAVKHEYSIGEYKAKISTIPRSSVR